MNSTNSFDVPPVFCAGCERELRFLFCLHCAFSGLDDTAIVANAREIRAMAKRPVGKIRAKAECVVCSRTITVGENTRLLTKGVVAHLECVRRLRDRLEDATRRQEPRPLAGDLPFGGVALEVK